MKNWFFFSDKIKYLQKQMAFLVNTYEISLSEAAQEILNFYTANIKTKYLAHLGNIDRDHMKISTLDAQIVCEPVRINLAAGLIKDKNIPIESALRLVSLSSLEMINSLIANQNYELIDVPAKTISATYFHDINKYNLPQIQLFINFF